MEDWAASEHGLVAQVAEGVAVHLLLESTLPVLLSEQTVARERNGQHLPASITLAVGEAAVGRGVPAGQGNRGEAMGQSQETGQRQSQTPGAVEVAARQGLDWAERVAPA